MLLFLFDDPDGDPLFIRCENWSEAEKVAEARGLTLVGEFLHFVDAVTGEKEKLH